MDIYGNFRSVDISTYRGVKVELFRADKGRKHCGIQHEFHEKKCTVCAAKLHAKSVIVVSIADTLLDESFNNVVDASEYAKYAIDASRDDDPNHEEDPDEPAAPEDPPEDEEPPKTPRMEPPSGRNISRARLLLMIQQSGLDKKLAALARKDKPPPKKE